MTMRAKTVTLGILCLFMVGGFYFLTEREEKPKFISQPRQILFGFDGEQNDQGIPAPWQLKTSLGKELLKVWFDPQPERGKVLWVKAENASFFLGRTDQQFLIADYPLLEWSWSAITLPSGGDVRKSSISPFAENKNDQVLQLLVTFDTKEVLSYMWDTTAPAGTEVTEHNLFVGIKAVVVESGSDHLGQWCSYRRSVLDDYRRLHGGKARLVTAIAVQTNSNHTASECEGFFGVICFKKD